MRKPYVNTSFFTWSVSFYIALILTALICAFIKCIPFDTDIEKYNGVLLKKIIQNCLPEPWEFLQYVSFIVFFPIIFLIVGSIIKKNQKITENRYSYYTTVGMLIVTYMGLANLIVYYQIRNILFYKYIIIAIPFALLIGWLNIKRRNKNQLTEKIFFFVIMSCVFIYAFYRISSLNFMMQAYEYNYHHYYAWWYPIYKVNSGQCIGIDFENIYGFYPYFIVPLLRLLGNTDQATIPLLISILLIVVSLGYYIFCYRFINNKILAVITATVCSFLGAFRALGDTFYLQYNPTRTLFLSLALILISIHSCLKKRHSKSFLNIFNCVVMAIGLCWNFESGLIALVLYGAYCFFFDVSSKGISVKKTIVYGSKVLLFILTSLVLFLVIVEAITYSLSSKFIGKEQLFFGITVFAGNGFFMLPINYIGAWLIVAIVFLVGISVAISILISRNDTEYYKFNNTGLFVAAVMGIGAFSYFVGRSDKEVIKVLLPECVLVCAFLAEYFLSKISFESFHVIKSANKIEKINKTINSINALLCLVFVLYCITFNCNTLRQNFSEKYNLINFGDPSVNVAYNYFDEPAKEIHKWSDMNNNGELPNILTYYSVYYDELLGKKANENVCEMIDWFYKDNAHSFLDFINTHSDKVFVISESAIKILESEFEEEYSNLMKNFHLSKRINASELEGNYLYIYSPS